jgi:S-adenosylmethionine decarboxylase
MTLYSLLSSESSMFVSKRRWILKTCGTTTPLQCMEPMLRMAFEIAGFTEIEGDMSHFSTGKLSNDTFFYILLVDLFYSRKNYKRPDLQISPHHGFDEEVAYLDQFFDDGRAYILGSVNKGMQAKRNRHI